MTDYKDDEDVKRRQAHEDRVAMSVFVVAFLLLAGVALIYVSDIFSPSPGGIVLPDGTPVFGSNDPSINPYHEDGLPEATVRGTVTDIVPRDDKMPDGSKQTNYYARTEYYLPVANMDCYFHHFLGPDVNARFTKGQNVSVAYQPHAQDPCGSSRIDE